MDHIFGDTHDITFGNTPRGPKATPQRDAITPTQNKLQNTPQVPRARGANLSHHNPSHKKDEAVSRGARGENATPSISDTPALTRLIGSMKPSFFPKEEDTSVVRLVMLSSGAHHDPLMLVTRDDETILIGSGFATTTRAGKMYSTFPDMRLVFSEKDHISAWILTNESIDISPFVSLLPSLGFPPIYATRAVIARFRSEISDTTFLEKCRFFELFSSGSADRRIGTFEFSLAACENTSCLLLRTTNVQVGIGHISLAGTVNSSISREEQIIRSGEAFLLSDEKISTGDILLLRGKNVSKHALKFTFDTFYIDGNSIGVVAGYTLGDREQLSENGVLIFTLEEDIRARTIAGHIFIDSRGFVHAYEMMSVHKEILKGIRATYEKLILENQKIERGELVQTLRREITKYCYVLTGRTPVVMPIVIER